MTDMVSMSADAAGTVAARLRAVNGELADLYLERSDVVRALTVGVLAGQHSLLLGPPGTAKSELARELTSRIDGARFWEILLSRFSDPKSIFGPIDVAALTAGRYVQLLDGRATTADVGFVDEIFKCGPAALNSMLAFMNERVYHPENGDAPVRCPLLSLVCASNELASGDELSAIFDRLLIRLEVGYLRDPQNFRALLRSSVAPAVPPTRTTLDLADLRAAVKTGVPAVKIPDAVIEAVADLRAGLRAQELTASDRRWKQCMRLVQASAFLDGRPEAGPDDVLVLAHALWETVETRVAVERVVLELVHPASGEALTLGDAVAELGHELDAKAGQSIEKLSDWVIKKANPELRKAAKRLAELLREAEVAGRPTAVLREAAARCAELQERIRNEVL
ncbi:AAA family ATPase [Catenulispora yoronensis]|uniref:AAA family ATPase n=1 Tax=Catenulispora yoronensis TaxID=450799 RepID=A0ABP5H5Y0_9ACTN